MWEECKQMFRETKSILKDDHIKVGKYYIRSFSIPWWIVRVSQIVGVLFSFYLIYLLFWILIG